MSFYKGFMVSNVTPKLLMVKSVSVTVELPAIRMFKAGSGQTVP